MKDTPTSTPQSNTDSPVIDLSRRSFLKTAGAAGALSGVAIPHVFGQERSAVHVALIGCGGRGTGAAAQALSVTAAPTKLVAMADVFQNRQDESFRALERGFGNQKEKFDVPPERRFIGFEAYKEAMDCLRPGDIAIFTTPLAFRWVHFAYAIEKGLHVFMEKPLTADGPSSRKMIELAKKADEKNLKVGVGLMVRHCRGRMELHDRIQNGEIGEIINMRSYRMHGPVASCFSKKKPDDISETMFQINRFHSFIWASGGLFNDFYIHFIDETCWMKNKWPVKAQALGGRHYRGDFIDQNFDTYSVEYTFDDGTTLFFDGRTMLGCMDKQASYVHGTKGSAIVSTAGHTPGKVRIFSGQRQHRDDLVWAFPQPEPNPYQTEWDDLVTAIRDDTPYNEVERGVMASVVSNLGRFAAHTGQSVTLKEMLESDIAYAPDADKMTADGPAPVVADADGRYPVPEPGIKVDREY
ncbi:MAG: Gfo/Idh/MocA family oxidoreductase [Verrucomicrobiae bacterium]|nr:Gfo/Idh/MocA family oxidoreductase [Verrucomicrobiae bacterium]